MVILFLLMYAVDLVAEYFEMVPQDIIYIRCRGQSLAADFFQDFKDFPFRRGTDIERGAEARNPISDKKCLCSRAMSLNVAVVCPVREHSPASHPAVRYDRFGRQSERI